MAFTGDEDQTIQLPEAVKFTKNYRDSVNDGDFCRHGLAGVFGLF